MANLKLFGWIAALNVWRDRDLTGTGQIVVHLQVGRFSPPRRRHFVLKGPSLTTHNGRVSSAMNHDFAKTQHPKRAVNG